jgi:hypothetical protein
MNVRLAFLAAPILALASTLAAPAYAAPKECDEFEELQLTLERNATDGDTEVVLFAQGQDDGLKKLLIRGPNGRRIASIEADSRGIGIREFLLESAEPAELELVLASFPEGEYRFFGRSVEKDCLLGTATLSHEIAPETTLLTPAADSTVDPGDVVLSWTAVPSAVAYVVGLNDEDTGAESLFTVFPPVTSLEIPSAAIEPGSEYQFEVGVRTANGNLTFVEHNFFTAEE